ncbi:hypothetical protein [Streptomyces sp. NBC_00154]|uniref:hypothetical protein n=1 Tax=Streptomyces sp. NBC_00154 TaxID=2975670 RepID=UPI0022553EC6|nr:hypothetical protein [Streptomyces sp. NBC_00154]MCX5311043.1 hypothetical protein [Streptomyces sp. NBC_00154]
MCKASPPLAHYRSEQPQHAPTPLLAEGDGILVRVTWMLVPDDRPQRVVAVPSGDVQGQELG